MNAQCRFFLPSRPGQEMVGKLRVSLLRISLEKPELSRPLRREARFAGISGDPVRARYPELGRNDVGNCVTNFRRTTLRLVILFLCLFVTSPLSAQTLRKVIIGVSNPDNVTFFPLYLAKEAGYFREQGLDPQLIVMNSDLAVKALVTGDVDYAASTASVAKAAALGFPVKIVVSFFNGTDFSLVSKPEIKVPSDLKNKIVAVSRFGSAADFDAREALSHLGLDPAKDVQIIPVGAGPNRLISLLTGKVDAAIINVAESIRAQEQGMRVLISTGKFNRQTLTGLGTATNKIAQNRDEVRRVLRAVTRAVDDYKNRKDKIQPLLIRHTRIKPEHFEFVYQKNLEVLSPDGSLGEGDVKSAYMDARKSASNPPAVEISSLFDLSVLRESHGK